MEVIHPFENPVDRGRRHIEQLGDFLLGKLRAGRQVADHSHIHVRQLRRTILRADQRMKPPLTIPVVRVVRRGSKEQMTGADARGIVATVTDPKPLWDLADVQLP